MKNKISKIITFFLFCTFILFVGFIQNASAYVKNVSTTDGWGFGIINFIDLKTNVTPNSTIEVNGKYYHF